MKLYRFYRIIICVADILNLRLHTISENSEMKQKICLLKNENKELNKVSKQVNTESWIYILHLDFIERNQKVNIIVLSRVEENDVEKTTEVSMEILKK